MLFIPHDFLHRLPLHGAIKDKKDKKVFLEDYQSCYLPAWSFANKDKANPSKLVALKNTDDSEERQLQLINKITWYIINENKLSGNSFIEKLEKLANPPKLLCILCHGEADFVNPFSSKLKFEGGLSLLKFQQSNISLNNTKVILGACEADLMHPLSDEIDEHLTFTSVFLNKYSSEVLGTQWRALWPRIGKVINKLSPFDDLTLKLQEWQKSLINEWQGHGNDDTLYECLPFRVIRANFQ